MAIEHHIEPVPQHVLGVSIVNAEAVEVLVLHQQPTHVAPEEIDQRAVGILLLVRVVMMAPMNRHPARRMWQKTTPGEGDPMPQPFRAREAPVCKKAMIAEIDPEPAKDINARHC